MNLIKKPALIICLLILIVGYLSADTTIPEIPTDMTPPRYKNLVKPVYPVEAQTAEKGGTVHLLATIDVKGIPQNIKAITKLGFGLEEAALEALKKSTFHPATKDGKPISVTVRIPFEFKLEPADSPYPGMVLIPAGEFQMGSDSGNPDEKPRHPVTLNAFYIDRYEVTNAQYKAFVDANPQWGKDQIQRIYHDGYYLAHWNGNDYPFDKGDSPVVYVSWYAAMAYAQWAEKRLPTEAEWEKAARGGLINKIYPWGDSIDANKSNYFSGTGKGLIPVGSYPPNGYDLYDMAGNAREWCLDVYDATFYANSPRQNPVAGVSSIAELINNFVNLKDNRVVRGGSWLNGARSLQVANRSWRAPTDTNPNEGFRCVKEAAP